MDKFKTFEKIFMGVTFVCATISFLLNFKNGFTSYSWQLSVMMWVSISYLKQRMIDDCENDNR
jgi:hypothetical protein